MVNWAAHHVSRLAPRSVAPHPNRSPTPVSKGTMGMRACRTCGKGTYRRRPFNFCNACRPSFRGLHRMPAEVQEQMLVDRFHTPVKQAFEVNPGALQKARGGVVRKGAILSPLARAIRRRIRGKSSKASGSSASLPAHLSPDAVSRMAKHTEDPDGMTLRDIAVPEPGAPNSPCPKVSPKPTDNDTGLSVTGAELSITGASVLQALQTCVLPLKEAGVDLASVFDVLGAAVRLATRPYAHRFMLKHDRYGVQTLAVTFLVLGLKSVNPTSGSTELWDRPVSTMITHTGWSVDPKQVVFLMCQVLTTM